MNQIFAPANEEEVLNMSMMMRQSSHLDTDERNVLHFLNCVTYAINK